MQVSDAIEATAENISASFHFVELCPNYKIIEKCIPSEQNELLPGIKWGNYFQLYTPAFWKFMYLTYSSHSDSIQHKIGSNIIEEIVACLLGGYGMPSEIGILAFQRLQNEKLMVPGTSLHSIKKALYIPFKMKDGSLKRYRFFNQKSQYIYQFLQRTDLESIPSHDDISFRNWLLSIKGIGLKTASWITRNWLQSERVAILDIHILRAGRITGFFEETDNVAREYLNLENSYINFCKALEVRPSNMDAIIWGYMKKTNKLALQLLSNS